MANVTLLGASYSDVPSVVLPQTGGGTSTFYDMSGANSWMGLDAEYVQQLYDASFTLDDTDYPSWTPSTTAKSLLATANVTTFTADMANYEYYLRWKFRLHIAYAAGTSMVSAPTERNDVIYQGLFRRSASVTAINNKTMTTNTCQNLHVAPFMFYYNASGTLTLYMASTYGFYASATAATISSTTAAKPTVTVKRPTVNVRCNSTYLSTTAAAAVDTENSNFRFVADLFRFKKGSIMTGIYRDALDSFHNMLT